ncbi:hypothetical protein PR002_g8532 [Phytophthora rubi]|uniref:Rho-GAP domain-containing protein n=1 Tax=Phytophthora rubi TaxID=129364 RepID=A0A6A3N0D7_9STRA|nr:hypothetical protein PR002_g8532 [Phytophthora rubi]
MYFTHNYHRHCVIIVLAPVLLGRTPDINPENSNNQGLVVLAKTISDISDNITDIDIDILPRLCH